MENEMTATLSLPLRVQFDKPKEIKLELLRLLKEDEDVKQLIRDNLPASNYVEPNKDSCDTYEQKNTSTLENELRMRNEELGKLKLEIQSLKDSSKSFAPFKESIKLYQDYQILPVDIREQFSNVFRQEGLSAFIFSLAQQDAPIEIWDAIKRCLDEYDADFDFLNYFKSMLSFSVLTSNSSRGSTKQLEILEPEIGTPFSDRWHCVFDAGGNKQGKISEVKFPGLAFSGEAKALRTSLVLLR